MSSNDLASRIGAMVDVRRMVAEVCELVDMETPSQDLPASARIAGRLADSWRAYGTARIVGNEGGSHLLVEVPGAGLDGTSGAEGSAPVVLLGHSDTVWPIGTLDGDLPLDVKDDRVQGPGAYDMKSGLVVMRDAVRILGALGLAHPPLRVVIAADEEIGSASATPLVERACTGARAVIGFESPHPDGALKVGRLGSARVRLRVVGREAHAALDPQAGISAIDEIVDQLLLLRDRVTGVARRYPGQVLLNAGTISGGTRTNVVAGQAEALIGLRFGSARAQQEVMAVVQGLRPIRAGAELSVDVLSSRPAWQAGPADAELLELARQTASAAGQEVEGRPAAGAGDTNTTGALGTPTLDGMGPRGGGAHALGEHADIASIAERVVLLTLLLHALG